MPIVRKGGIATTQINKPAHASAIGTAADPRLSSASLWRPSKKQGKKKGTRNVRS